MVRLINDQGSAVKITGFTLGGLTNRTSHRDLRFADRVVNTMRGERLLAQFAVPSVGWLLFADGNFPMEETAFITLLSIDFQTLDHCDFDQPYVSGALQDVRQISSCEFGFSFPTRVQRWTLRVAQTSRRKVFDKRPRWLDLHPDSLEAPQHD